MADDSVKPLLHTVAEVAALMRCPERWLLMQLRAGRFPGRKVQRQWRMSDADIARVIELCVVRPRATEATGGLSLG